MTETTTTTTGAKPDPSQQGGSSRNALIWGLVASLLFTALIWWAGQRLAAIPHLPDQGASWYYWKLPEPEPWARITSWGFYIANQLTMWFLIYYAQTRVKRYSSTLHRINYIALGANAFFILLHLVQTQIWYDGLAQDVSIWSSQGSVILLLVLVLLMENKRRGLFWGRKVPLSTYAVDFVRKYHGYIFSWGIVYTFWYHPMEPSSGHLIGFFYMFMLMLQGSLFFTRIHLNRWWTVALEISVALHGALVAVMNANNMWPMFFFGFGGIFVITQMHGVPLSNRTRWIILGAYILAALGVYSQFGLAKIHQITWIPAIEYLAVFVLAFLIAAGLWIARKLQRSTAGMEAKA
jgi:hypothetical protein